MECQNGVSRMPEANITDLAGILSNWDALCLEMISLSKLSELQKFIFVFSRFETFCVSNKLFTNICQLLDPSNIFKNITNSLFLVTYKRLGSEE